MIKKMTIALLYIIGEPMPVASKGFMHKTLYNFYHQSLFDHIALPLEPLSVLRRMVTVCLSIAALFELVHPL